MAEQRSRLSERLGRGSHPDAVEDRAEAEDEQGELSTSEESTESSPDAVEQTEGHDPNPSEPIQSEALEVAAEEDLVGDLRAALKWAIDKLSHPADQMELCPTHGRVPLTHMCSVYRNDDWAKAVEMSGGATA